MPAAEVYSLDDHSLTITETEGTEPKSSLKKYARFDPKSPPVLSSSGDSAGTRSLRKKVSFEVPEKTPLVHQTSPATCQNLGLEETDTEDLYQQDSQTLVHVRDRFRSKRSKKKCLQASLTVLFMLVIFALIIVLVVTLN